MLNCTGMQRHQQQAHTSLTGSTFSKGNHSALSTRQQQQQYKCYSSPYCLYALHAMRSIYKMSQSVSCHITLAPRSTSADCLTATHSSVLPGCASCVQGANWVHKDLMNLRPSRLYTLWYMAGCKGSSKAGPAPFVLSQKQRVSG